MRSLGRKRLADWPALISVGSRFTAHIATPVVKPTPPHLFLDKGSGADYETRLSALHDYLTPNDRFYIRSHSPTPEIDVASWRLTIDGSGVERRIEISYADLLAMPQAHVTRVIECAGNGRRFFQQQFGRAAEGDQWGLGAIGCAEWTGVRLRHVLELAGLSTRARHVMPEGLDEKRVSRPMPIDKALRDDTLLVLKMNGEALPADHGFPARILVSGWLGTASIKWVGRIQVSEDPLYSKYNTTEYVLIGPEYPAEPPAAGVPIAEMPVISMLDLDWPARLNTCSTTIRGRAYAGEGKVRAVAYSIDGALWRRAELLPPNIEGSWVRFQIEWNPAPGEHNVRSRAMDNRGQMQPDIVLWNEHGYLYNAVVSHPIIVE